MKSTKKEKKQYKKAFQEAMARELREHKSSFIVFSILRILVLVVLVRQIMLANYEGAFFCILTLLLLYVPSWIQVKLRIELPPPLEITIFCFIFAAEILGEVNAFYVVIPGWDTMLHTINGFLAAAVGFSMVMLLNDDDRITFHLSPAFLALVAFCFSMTIGVLWEFFEFGMDFFLGTDMQKDTVIHAIHSVSLDPTLSNKVVTIPDIQDVVINGESLGLGGYLDIGIIDTMKDLFVNFIGAVVFSLSGFFFARSKGRRKSAAQGFVPSKKTAEQDYLQQALEEADQKDADAPTPDGPPAPGEQDQPPHGGPSKCPRHPRARQLLSLPQRTGELQACGSGGGGVYPYRAEACRCGGWPGAEAPGKHCRADRQFCGPRGQCGAPRPLCGL